MTVDAWAPVGLERAVEALEADLLAEGGPRISTMRNHNFAIVLYDPVEEYRLRARVHRLVQRLEKDHGWGVLSIGLHDVLFEHLESRLGADGLRALVEQEKRLFDKDKSATQRSLKHVSDKLAPYVDGLAPELAARIARFREQNPDADRTLVLLGRTGALYPFFRSSALLKQLGDQTLNTPVVLLYPGERRDGGLSFMKELDPDRDYRPRIYA